MASPWRVDDCAKRELMEGFYAAFLRDEKPQPVAAALQETALALRDKLADGGTTPYPAPRFWAAFLGYGR